MTFPNHVALGLIVGKLTGSYELAVVTSVLVDLDHLLSYAKHGVLKNPKLFWQTITNPEDPWGDQRGILHSLFSLVIISFFAYLLSPMAGNVIFLSYLGHLFLDAISDSDSWFFRPFSNLHTRGFISYCSKYEVLFFVWTILIFCFI